MNCRFGFAQSIACKADDAPGGTITTAQLAVEHWTAIFEESNNTVWPSVSAARRAFHQPISPFFPEIQRGLRMDVSSAFR